MYRFPKDSKLYDPKFLFGVATASYQIEGATDVDDRCPSNLGYFLRQAWRGL